jgi:hypothetical protein
MIVRFLKQLQSAGPEMIQRSLWLHRDYLLPFAPHVGLHVVDGDWEAKVIDCVCDLSGRLSIDIDPSKPGEIAWLAYAAADRFWWSAGEEEAIDDAIAAAVADHQNCGWKVKSGFDRDHSIP